MAAVAVTAAGLAGQGAAGQGSPLAPTLFRRRKIGSTFPVVPSPRQEPRRAVRAVVAFLRPDQDASRRVLQALARLALVRDLPPADLVVVGAKELVRGQWARLFKGMPRRVELVVDGGDLGREVGLIVRPTVAVLDRARKLRSGYLLYEDGLAAWVEQDLRALAAGKPVGLDENRARERRYAEISAAVAVLLAADRVDDAMLLRREQLELGLHPAEVLAGLGNLHLVRGDPKQAAVSFRRSLAARPTLAAGLGLGRARLESGNLDAARTQLRKLLPSGGRKAAIHRALAEVAKQQGDLPAALAEIKAALAARRAEPWRRP